MNRLLSATELAKYLGLEPVTVRRKAKRGEIPSIRIGNRLRFDIKQIDRWLLKTSSLRMLNILVVDDEPEVGRLFENSLIEYGYKVTTTTSSTEALKFLGNRHYSIVFIDLKMPVLDGSELFAKIRQLDQEVPVVIITGYPDSDLMYKAMKYGPFLVMKKPFSSDDIVNAIGSIVREVEPGND